MYLYHSLPNANTTFESENSSPDFSFFEEGFLRTQFQKLIESSSTILIHCPECTRFSAFVAGKNGMGEKLIEKIKNYYLVIIKT